MRLGSGNPEGVKAIFFERQEDLELYRRFAAKCLRNKRTILSVIRACMNSYLESTDKPLVVKFVSPIFEQETVEL